MKIERFKNQPQTVAELVDLIMYCQNTEANLGIKMAEQADVFDIVTYYQHPGGDFWIARANDCVVGSIGLLKLNDQVGVLKKLFTYPEFRGQPHRLGQQLLQTLLAYVHNETHLTRLVLDTPAAEKRSHAFYEKHGFQQIERKNLAVQYPFPDRDSLIYELKIAR
ncbi:GNAT family N-acetyltransferase [Lactiplantibacillus fabifermentans]|uniref:Acetyltransferase n=2 Tax=Lactiplantibacillus fabifermentans TaxID=483011 RepID=A0A0R2NMA9_9LACO|nr:GNAT family N-acetyltransferase [Lactiplantibacillus fabifermentans]ETY73278.1 GNAT family acetyltransferase [Lactiplantibacillus fabifermentans T30PCM01]KRO26852.1 acetyltransferase [Lactiplantibacillus fabifermentans DSM 21115]